MQNQILNCNKRAMKKMRKLFKAPLKAMIYPKIAFPVSRETKKVKKWYKKEKRYLTEEKVETKLNKINSIKWKPNLWRNLYKLREESKLCDNMYAWFIWQDVLFFDFSLIMLWFDL